MNGTITVAGTLTGALSASQTLVGALSPSVGLSGELSLGEGTYAPPYEGDYTVTPILNASQTLETDGRLMLDDVTVYEIPVTWTTNPEEGWTVLIG